MNNEKVVAGLRDNNSGWSVGYEFSIKVLG